VCITAYLYRSTETCDKPVVSLKVALLGELGRELSRLVLVILLVLGAARIDTVEARALVEAVHGNWNPLEKARGHRLIVLDHLVELLVRLQHRPDLLRRNLVLTSMRWGRG
jgi:hypothetical protein